MEFIKVGLFTFAMGTFLFVLLMLVNKSSSSTLKKVFTIPARKSSTDAIQLGGLPLSFAVLSGLFFSIRLFDFTQTQLELMKFWSMASGVVIVYGHLDDKFELRPIVKLCMQVFAVVLFALPASQLIYPKWSALGFLFISFWSMGVLNGGNLLDGLDTLTIKLSSVTFTLVMALSFTVQSEALTVLSTVGLFAIASFYYFNREPALVHLGEIGGSFIGFFSLLCSCLLFEHMLSMNYYNLDISLLSLSLLPLLLPMCEIGVSFSRRILNKKSPFKGDKYHLHHILRNYYKFSPSTSATLFALSYFTIATLAVLISKYVNPLSGFTFSLVTMVGCYFIVGKKHWVGKDTIEINPTSLFQYLRKKDVTIINSLEFDQFTIEITDQAYEDEAFEQDDDDDIKKAA